MKEVPGLLGLNQEATPLPAHNPFIAMKEVPGIGWLTPLKLQEQPPTTHSSR